MKSNIRKCLGAAALVAAWMWIPPAATAQSIEGAPLTARNFTSAAPRGFGDRNNSWPQAMFWWKNHLYVGTSRQSICTSLFGIYQYAVAIAGKTLADTFLPYPPRDPDISCAPDPADLSLAAEIWRWSPNPGAWQRVYQSPVTLDNPGPGPPAPPRTGKKLPYEISFRGITSHREPDGTEALYAFGVNSTILWDRNQLPPPRILRSTDGVTWTPLPQTPGTFLHTLPFNPDHSSFRSPASFDGKLFVLSGPVFGQGYLIASANPAAGDNSWFLAGPPNMLFYEIQEFNGWLYLGGFDPTSGYAVFKTRAQGPAPYPLTMVVPPGGSLVNRPSKSVVSMQVHNGRLYVGTATQTEVVRVNPDDTWDLVIGEPRFDPRSNEWKYPIGNLDAGFGHTLNDHAWYMTDPYKHLYIGTYNAATGSRLDPAAGPLLRHNMGGHLYRTPDNWYFTAVTTNGFAGLNDPRGGPFDFGVRTMASTPHGVFLGTANDYYGLGIFRAAKRASPPISSPERLEIEPATTGGALLSWAVSPRSRLYRIYRAEIRPILVRDDANFEGWNGITGNKIPDTYITPYTAIGTTAGLYYHDTTARLGVRYIYYVAGEYLTAVSEPSSLATFPTLYPPMTFTRLLAEIDKLARRGRFIATDPQGNAVRAAVLAARASAAACQLTTAVAQLNPAQLSRTAVLPEAIDLEVLLGKMVRRLQLRAAAPSLMNSPEFCTTAR